MAGGGSRARTAEGRPRSRSDTVRARRPPSSGRRRAIADRIQPPTSRGTARAPDRERQRRARAPRRRRCSERSTGRSSMSVEHGPALAELGRAWSRRCRRRPSPSIRGASGPPTSASVRMPDALRSTRCGKRFGGDAALAPVAQHHGGGGAAAQQLGLGNEGNVEEWKGPRFLRRERKRLRRHEGGAAQGHGPHPVISRRQR